MKEGKTARRIPGVSSGLAKRKKEYGVILISMLIRIFSDQIRHCVHALTQKNTIFATCLVIA